MNTKVNDVLKKKGSEVFTIANTALLKDVVGMLNAKQVGALLVVNDKKDIVGIVSERDVLLKMAQGNGEIKDMSVKIAMTPKEKLIVGTLDDSIEYLMKVMTNNRIRHIPILDPGDNAKLCGIISIGDVVKAMLQDMDYENKMLKDYIEGTYPV